MTCAKERDERVVAVLLGSDQTLAAKLADVHFSVTDVVSGEKRVFPSIRALCAIFSSEMERMFFGDMVSTKAGCRVPIEGCRLQGFEWLLSHFYGLRPTLSADNVAAVLQCADRFKVDTIKKECIALIAEKREEGVDALLPILAETERLKLGSLLKETMQSLFADALFAAAVIESPNFAKSPTVVIGAVLRSDSLPLKEESLWQKAVEWAKQQWADGSRLEEAEDTEELKDDSLAADCRPHEDWRQLLKPFLPLFRFPLMDPKFLVAKVLPCALLSDKQVVSVFVAQNQAEPHCEYSCVPRSSAPRFAVESKILSSKEFADLSANASAKCGVDLGSCKLLFRGSDHGFASTKFHELCNGKGATLTVVQTEFGHVIGGFTAVPWTTSGSSKQDTSAWLFVSRVNDSKKPLYSGVTLPAILKANTAKTQHVYHHPSYGPTFGRGHDLYLASNCNASANSYCNCTGAFSFANVCDGVTLSVQAISGGTSGSFRVVDYEVFSVA